MAVSLPNEVTLRLALDEPDDVESLRERVARNLGVGLADVPEVALLGRSLDARRGRLGFVVRIGLCPEVAEKWRKLGPPPREVHGAPPVVIVGDGPAGLFCAYELARAAVASVIVERGKLVQPRRHDLVGVQRKGWVDPDSNYCFGEGGAGTFSDGKLYTRAKKRGDVDDVLRVLVEHGAPETIRTEGRPHIGSNRLPKVITAIRERLLAVGVGFRFTTRVVGLGFEAGRVTGVELADGSHLAARAVVFATGHSARDVYRMLEAAQLRLVPKPFAVGVRMEHPQPLINRIQYGSLARHPRLPSADYRLVHTEEGRGVFSFCMCPGGFIVPATTEADAVVVNGMSLSRRDSPYANSGLVVSVTEEDLAEMPLRGLALQAELEEQAYRFGGGGFRAPATRITDFLAGRASASLPESSYVPGLTPVDLEEVFRAFPVPIVEHLRRGLRVFGEQMRGLITEQGVLVGVESRTSSPVRIPRDPTTRQHPECPGLFPVGEGAGYAGGIVSAALDGMATARIIALEQARYG